MIVKYLKSSKTFAAVTYNENRVKKGEAELLDKQNFGSSVSLFDDNSLTKDYFQLWSSRNSRIKNPQLHVVFSTKNESHTKEQLKDIATEWLIQMGYGDVPYMIYFHKNSKHNHVHIVTTRIDKDGCKINDSFEHERGLRILNNIMGLDEYQEMRKKITSLLRFSYSTRTQFKELLSRSGMRVFDLPDKSGCRIEWGSAKTSLIYDVVDFCSKRYHQEIDKNRRKQIQAMIFKYSKLFNRDEFCHYLKQHLELDFIFYGKDNTINGFTVIDYSNKSVYKGSEILSLNIMNDLFASSESKKIEPVNILLNYLFQNKYSNLTKTENYLSRFGISIAGDKLVDMFGVTYDIPDTVLNYWSHINRLDYISSHYRVNNYNELRFLAAYLNMDFMDLKHFKYNDYAPFVDTYKSIINSYGLSNILQYPELLKQFEWQLFSFDNKAYIVDESRGSVVSLDELFDKEEYIINYSTVNHDITILSEPNSDNMISASMFNFDSNIGSSSKKGKRRRY